MKSAKILGFLVFMALVLTPFETTAQSYCYPSWSCTDRAASNPSWQDRQEQDRLESRLREQEYLNRRLRARREQERTERKRARDWRTIGGGTKIR